MIKSLVYLVVILIGLSLSPYIFGNSGYVYIAFGDWQLETSLIFAAVALFVIMSAVKLLEMLIVGLLGLMFRSRYLPVRWRQQAAKKHNYTGALALAEENWQQAEHSLAKAADSSEFPAISYFSAASAAHHLGKNQERDSYLAKAIEYPEAQLGAKITQLRYWLQQGELIKANASLQQLSLTSKSPNTLLKLASDVYSAHQNWHELKLLLPLLKKNKVVSKAEFEQLETTTLVSLLQAAQHDITALETCWHWLTRTQRQQAEFISAYALGLSRLDKHSEAIKLLLKACDNAAPTVILKQLTHVYRTDDVKVLPHLYKLLERFDDNPQLHSCLAQLALLNRDFKAAITHYQKLCKLEPMETSHWFNLATIQERLGNNQDALISFHRASDLVLQKG
ncbi:heme biosynthesis protein HemY [Shewanella sp. SNU WT4]|uniref:heme biosynthesis HemY N-terminal domain-containing protein n=1 Tax=Shewanella sp. SNU WT4 TaxID=2590015 RepID=UPI001128D29C|nr:heme biosynthesis HemY N-terminal domain-containing protein [Shewanella sp. SNU WT4]QDF65286.1 heme biosynthesis protein HemY [Shewanella sp. SNU WT4]